MTKRTYSQYCGLAYALDVVGERWSLLIVRELVPGPRRFKDLVEGLPGISTNLLTERLRLLEQTGVVEHNVLAPPAGSSVYGLTERGRGLQPALLELGRWGSQFVPPEPGDNAVLRLGAYALTPQTFFRPERATDLDETIEWRAGGETLQIHIAHGRIGVTQAQTRTPDVIFESDVATYLALLVRDISPAVALSQQRVSVTSDPSALDRFVDLCGLPAPEGSAGTSHPA
jgi:DNA-binding HxlR family transcriptional regulator